VFYTIRSEPVLRRKTIKFLAKKNPCTDGRLGARSIRPSVVQDTFKSILRIQDKDTFQKYSEDTRYIDSILKILFEDTFRKILCQDTFQKYLKDTR